MGHSADSLILFRMLTAYVVAGYIFRATDRLSGPEDASRSVSTILRALLVGGLTYAALWERSAVLPALIVAGGHYVVDIVASRRSQSTRNLLVTVACNIVIIVLVWGWFADLLRVAGPLFFRVVSQPAVWIVLLSYLIVLEPTGQLVGMITSRWQDDLIDGERDTRTGLRNAGLWIGRIERFIILTLILISQYSAIGFLIAAKSIFRFRGRLEDDRQRKEAEYILIGTLLSFALAITVGIIARAVLTAP